MHRDGYGQRQIEIMSSRILPTTQQLTPTEGKRMQHAQSLPQHPIEMQERLDDQAKKAKKRLEKQGAVGAALGDARNPKAPRSFFIHPAEARPTPRQNPTSLHCMLLSLLVRRQPSETSPSQSQPCQ